LSPFASAGIALVFYPLRVHPLHLLCVAFILRMRLRSLIVSSRTRPVAGRCFLHLAEGTSELPRQLTASRNPRFTPYAVRDKWMQAARQRDTKEFISSVIVGNRIPLTDVTIRPFRSPACPLIVLVDSR
jgi:hypothetical protein